MQIQLCRDAVVGIFSQRTAVTDDSTPQSGSEETISDEWNARADVDQLDWTKLIKHKETAALWELLKLSSSLCKESLSQSRATLSNALLGKV